MSKLVSCYFIILMLVWKFHPPSPPTCVTKVNHWISTQTANHRISTQTAPLPYTIIVIMMIWITVTSHTATWIVTLVTPVRATVSFLWMVKMVLIQTVSYLTVNLSLHLIPIPLRTLSKLVLNFPGHLLHRNPRNPLTGGSRT